MHAGNIVENRLRGRMEWGYVEHVASEVGPAAMLMRQAIRQQSRKREYGENTVQVLPWTVFFY